MGRIVAIAAVTHNPLFWRAFQAADIDAQLRAVRARFEDLRDHLAAAAPDGLIVVGTDHLTQWATENMPAFMVGKAPRYAATFHNETREFGIPEFAYDNDVDLARQLLDGCLDRRFDLASSDEFRVDHAFSVPYEYLAPAEAPPMIPLWTNCIAPPLPRPDRFVELGQALRDVVENLPSQQRVAIVASGHLAVEVGGPRHFRGSPDPDFDRRAIEWLAQADIDAAVAGSTFEALLAAGNVTHQFMNFLLAMGAAGGEKPSIAEALPSKFASSPFVLWE